MIDEFGAASNYPSGSPNVPDALAASPDCDRGVARPVSARSTTALRQLVTLATNVTILTALLVYFGWQRTERQAAQLGVDESILGLSTRDYLLRSVGPVLQLLAIVAVGGMLAVYLDRGLRRRIERRGPKDRVLRITFVAMSVAWFILPAAIIGLGYIERGFAYIAFPLSIASGVLLLVYVNQLRSELRGHKLEPIGRLRLEHASVLVVLCVALFWATSNYAVVIGDQLASETIHHVKDLTSVIVYSRQRLGISAHGTKETPISGSRQEYRFKYTGLHLLEHADGKYFLIPDRWNRDDGVIIVIRDSPSFRFEFGGNTAK